MPHSSPFAAYVQCGSDYERAFRSLQAAAKASLPAIVCFAQDWKRATVKTPPATDWRALLGEVEAAFVRLQEAFGKLAPLEQKLTRSPIAVHMRLVQPAEVDGVIGIRPNED